MISILLTGGGGSGNEALYRLLENKYKLHFADADIDAIDPSIPKTQRHQIPWANNPNFLDTMKQLCQHLEIQILIPGVDEELLLLARNSHNIQPTCLLLPTSSYVETMLDKLHMAHALREKGILVPFSQSLSDDFSQFRFPCILKPRSGRGSRGVRVINTMEEAKEVQLKLEYMADSMLLQEKIEGIEYTVQMAANSQGQLCAIVPVRVDIKRGITIRARTEADPHVINACEAIHNAMPTPGCYNIQLIKDSKNNVFPFEINPRVSTTLCLVVAAGIDPVSIFCGEQRDCKLSAFDDGLQLHRHWKNYFLKEG